MCELRKGSAKQTVITDREYLARRTQIHSEVVYRQLMDNIHGNHWREVMRTESDRRGDIAVAIISGRGVPIDDDVSQLVCQRLFEQGYVAEKTFEETWEEKLTTIWWTLLWCVGTGQCSRMLDENGEVLYRSPPRGARYVASNQFNRSGREATATGCQDCNRSIPGVPMVCWTCSKRLCASCYRESHSGKHSERVAV